MLLFKLACKNLFRRAKRTSLLASLIFCGTVLLFTANAFFAGTAAGLHKSYSGSLTGNLVAAADSPLVTGIFGNDIPLVSDYEVIPALPSYAQLVDLLSHTAGVDSFSPVVSAALKLDIGSFSAFVPAFGVDSSTYFTVCPDITLERGQAQDLEAGKGGVFLNQVLVKQIEADLKRDLIMGEPLQLGIFTNGGFRIRRGFFAGVHRYVNETAPFDRIILADPVLIRDLVNYSLGYALQSSPTSSAAGSATGSTDGDALAGTFSSLDSLFSDEYSDVTADSSQALTIADVAAVLSQKTALVLSDDAAWSFLLIKTVAGMDGKIKHQLEQAAADRFREVKILGWKQAAGLNARAAFALQAAFTAGLGFIIFGAVLVITNALVIAVLERKTEIGVMRALGAKKSFVGGLFITETFILVVGSALAGIAVAASLCALVLKSGFVLHNTLLITLFGGAVLSPLVSLKSITLHLAGAALVSCAAWIYPVRVALAIQPVSIMGHNS